MKKKYYAKIAALNPAAGEKLPEWYLLFPAGKTDLESGPSYIVDETAYQAVVAHHTRRGLDPVVDYEHQTMQGTEAPAAGWIKEWRWDKEVGISARIEWTARAEQRIKEKEYRYYSPVFELAKIDGHYVLAVVHNVGLTNDPRTNNIQPLVAKRDDLEGKGVTLLEKLIAIGALGLAEDATEEQALEAVKALSDLLDEAADTKIDEDTEITTEVAKALGVKPDTDKTVILAKITSLTAIAANENDLSGKVAALEDKIAGQQAETLIAKHNDRLTPHMIEGMKEGGKFNYLMVLAKNDPEGFAATVKTFPVQIPNKITSQGKDGATDESGDLSEEALQIAKMMGNNPADVKKINLEDE